MGQEKTKFYLKKGQSIKKSKKKCSEMCTHFVVAEFFGKHFQIKAVLNNSL